MSTLALIESPIYRVLGSSVSSAFGVRGVETLGVALGGGGGGGLVVGLEGDLVGVEVLDADDFPEGCNVGGEEV